MSARTALALAAATLLMAACDNIRPPRTGERPSADDARSVASAPAAPAPAAAGGPFNPPSEADIPEGPFGDTVRRGRDIFLDTPTHAAEFVGNGLSCGNCHLDAGRKADSAPLWGAWVRYPAFRGKNQRVNNFTERLQGCFSYSMDGTAPPAGHDVLVALEAYSFWMSRGAPVGATLPGAGYPKGPRPPSAPDFSRGQAVFDANCAICHGADGQGQQVDGRFVFPPLWGPESYNWGAGMHQLDNAAAFIQANMPLGKGGTLSLQDAWDVALYMNGHERPQDPRFTGDVAETRSRFHDDPDSPYGTTVDGRLLGANPATR
ncbi:c-type cytochrome [Lysobacter sp. A3-1-A15]|uniref:c-type cytochrome n=1 Tax=Novilysobacter viscosus TaxID=3098602 RepID=UPI002EDAEA08